jgi:hypothetical protein
MEISLKIELFLFWKLRLNNDGFMSGVQPAESQ